MPESQKKELFSAGITYMVSGEYAFAFSCFTQAGKSDLPTLYNKALCYYYLSLYNDCRSLLLEAERLLPPLTERLPENLPEAVLRWEYEKSPAGCPMPEDAPDNLAAIEFIQELGTERIDGTHGFASFFRHASQRIRYSSG